MHLATRLRCAAAPAGGWAWGMTLKLGSSLAFGAGEFSDGLSPVSAPRVLVVGLS